MQQMLVGTCTGQPCGLQESMMASKSRSVGRLEDVPDPGRGKGGKGVIVPSLLLAGMHGTGALVRRPLSASHPYTTVHALAVRHLVRNNLRGELLALSCNMPSR